jgi:Protein of unknown function (DUF3047)
MSVPPSQGSSSTFAAAARSFLADLPEAMLREWIAGSTLVSLPGHQPPWQATGLKVSTGQSYSLFSSGRILWSPRRPSLYGGPKFHLWARIAPGGRIVNLTADTGTFVADRDGEIELGIYMGMWRNDRGELATSTALYERLREGIEVLVLGWRHEAAAGLTALARCRPDVGFLTSEIARLTAAAGVPAGWNYLLEAGEAEIFSAHHEADGRRRIRVDAVDDQGIITTPVDCALTPSTTIAWRWRVDVHPSTVAEDSVYTHDYLSVATEFETGTDLTWMWSSTLAPGTRFHCPIKAWTARETHVVVHSGSADFGQWCREECNVHDGASPMAKRPARIVRVWLIAVSSFQHGRLHAEFEDIVLRNEHGTVRVL